ncbi:MAG TPA: trypsin-like peptidase domain-containing protein, partial [Verrucomicrobiota bacterium]|nr:trypsin-like peptidase domain-containing protein [Verrucomicrobiota bacterium]
MKVNVQNWNRSSKWIALVIALAAVVIAFPSPAVSSAETDIRRDDTVRAVEEVMPCVVNIATSTMVRYQDFYDDLLRQFYGDRPIGPRTKEQLNSIGSGVIIDEDGYILTNFHVLRRASRIQVKLWDGREYDADPLVYTPLKDVALLKIRAKPGEKFKAIKFAADDDLLLGETVLALGNPYGLGGSVTRGILSSKNRRLTAGNEPLSAQDWLQTDAGINPGNSGGPLVNLRGELIGINVAVYREQQGMGVGFAIPIKQVAAAMAEFFSPEVMGSLWFGARVKPGTMPLLVTGVQPGSPAHQAGMKPGHQIVTVDGNVPRNLVDFNRLVAQAANRAATIEVSDSAGMQSLGVKMIPLD